MSRITILILMVVFSVQLNAQNKISVESVAFEFFLDSILPFDQYLPKSRVIIDPKLKPLPENIVLAGIIGECRTDIRGNSAKLVILDSSRLSIAKFFNEGQVKLEGLIDTVLNQDAKTELFLKIYCKVRLMSDEFLILIEYDKPLKTGGNFTAMFFLFIKNDLNVVEWCTETLM